MQFKLTINLDNAAFEDRADELPQILTFIAEILNNQASNTSPTGINTVRDSNGNSVGTWQIA